MISANMSNRNATRRHHRQEANNESLVEPRDESISRWTSQEIPAFPLPLNATSPKFPKRQASIRYRQETSMDDSCFTEGSVAPSIPRPSPLAIPGTPPKYPTRKSAGGRKMPPIDTCGRAASRASTRESKGSSSQHVDHSKAA